MITFNGSEPHIQRVIRRAFEVIKSGPKAIKLVPGAFINMLLKAIVIAVYEDLANNNLIQVDNVTPGAIIFDTTTASLLDPIPYDTDV